MHRLINVGAAPGHEFAAAHRLDGAGQAAVIIVVRVHHLSLLIPYQFDYFLVALADAEQLFVGFPLDGVLWRHFVDGGGGIIFAFVVQAQLVVVYLVVEQQIVATDGLALVQQAVQFA